MLVLGLKRSKKDADASAVTARFVSILVQPMNAVVREARRESVTWAEASRERVMSASASPFKALTPNTI